MQLRCWRKGLVAPAGGALAEQSTRLTKQTLTNRPQKSLWGTRSYQSHYTAPIRTLSILDGLLHACAVRSAAFTPAGRIPGRCTAARMSMESAPSSVLPPSSPAGVAGGSGPLPPLPPPPPPPAPAARPPPRGWWAAFKAAVKKLKHQVLALHYANQARLVQRVPQASGTAARRSGLPRLPWVCRRRGPSPPVYAPCRTPERACCRASSSFWRSRTRCPRLTSSPTSFRCVPGRRAVGAWGAGGHGGHRCCARCRQRSVPSPCTSRPTRPPRQPRCQAPWPSVQVLGLVDDLLILPGEPLPPPPPASSASAGRRRLLPRR